MLTIRREREREFWLYSCREEKQAARIAEVVVAAAAAGGVYVNGWRRDEIIDPFRLFADGPKGDALTVN